MERERKRERKKETGGLFQACQEHFGALRTCTPLLGWVLFLSRPLSDFLSFPQLPSAACKQPALCSFYLFPGGGPYHLILHLSSSCCQIFLVCRCQVRIDGCPIHDLTFPIHPILHPNQISQHFSNVLLCDWKCCSFCVIYWRYWWIQMLRAIVSKCTVFLSSPIFLLHHWKPVQHL